jgi:hypothetical protein
LNTISNSQLIRATLMLSAIMPSSLMTVMELNKTNHLLLTITNSQLIMATLMLRTIMPSSF